MWDGRAWSVQAPGAEHMDGQAQLMLDLGGWMLVRFALRCIVGAAPRRLAAVAPRRCAGGLARLRVALYASRQNVAAPQLPSAPRRAA